MRKLLIAAALAALSFTVVAQTAPGPFPGQGNGYGPGHGPMGGPRMGNDFSPGWGMMTPEERREHREKMRGFQDFQACQAYMEDHHKKMQERAAEQGRTPPPGGPGPGCNFLRKQG